MKRIQPHLVLPLASLALMGWTSPTYGNQGERTILTIDESLSEKIEHLEIDVEFGLGMITVERGNPAKAVTGYLEYDADVIRPEVRYEESGSRAHFRLETKTRRDGRGFDLDMDDLDEPNSELYFTTRVPIDLDFACGLGEGRLGAARVVRVNRITVEQIVRPYPVLLPGHQLIVGVVLILDLRRTGSVNLFEPVLPVVGVNRRPTRSDLADEVARLVVLIRRCLAPRCTRFETVRNVVIVRVARAVPGGTGDVTYLVVSE